MRVLVTGRILDIGKMGRSPERSAEIPVLLVEPCECGKLFFGHPLAIGPCFQLEMGVNADAMSVGKLSQTL